MLTSSLGILNYSRRLIREFSGMPDPGFNLVILVSGGNRDLFVSPPLPPWMSVGELPGPARGTGARRLWCDHVEVLRAARRHQARLIHFPKGWLPFRKPRGMRFMATLHDAIPEYEARHHPGHTRPGKRMYFSWAIRHSLRLADRILTDSDASRAHLSALVPEAAHKIQPLWIGPGISSRPPSGTRDSLLVLGSRQPHKATRQTLHLLAAWSARTPSPPPVRITGLSGWPVEWGPAPILPSATWLGRVSDDQMAGEYGRARALVFLSEIEGFGLPALEAVLAGAAVCYRNVSSVGELMQGAPGGWDGLSDSGFPAALEESLAAPQAVWDQVKSRLARDCRWDLAARKTLDEYRKMLD
ncbi:MAG: glycosyltransferase [Kiritimatiellia bacterium]